MIKSIKKHYSENDKLSLLIRHGDRNKIPDGTFGNEVMLNDKGIANSLSFGRELSEFNVTRIFTSPVGRCVQTANLIAEGMRKDIAIIEAFELGDPGLHISDAQIAGEFGLKNGFHLLYERFIQGLYVPGVPEKPLIFQSITDFLVTQTRENGIAIFVSHDLLIAFYHFSINKTVYSKENWVKYLSGLLLKNGKHEE